MTGPVDRLGALRLSIFSTILIFVLVPAGFVAVIAALALAGGSGRRARRYRPGRPYDFTPIWYLSTPDQVRAERLGAGDAGRRALPPAIESGVVETGGRELAGTTGGASDRW